MINYCKKELWVLSVCVLLPLKTVCNRLCNQLMHCLVSIDQCQWGTYSPEFEVENPTQE